MELKASFYDVDSKWNQNIAAKFKNQLWAHGMAFVEFINFHVLKWQLLQTTSVIEPDTEVERHMYNLLFLLKQIRFCTVENKIHSQQEPCQRWRQSYEDVMCWKFMNSLPFMWIQNVDFIEVEGIVITKDLENGGEGSNG